VLSWNNQRIQNHVDSVLKIPGSKLLFGGRPVAHEHQIPLIYGAY